MTPQEIKETLLKHIDDGLYITFTTFPALNDNTDIYMSYRTCDAKDFMEKKAIMDNLTRLLVDEGYRIKMSNIEIEKAGYYQSIMFDNKRETKWKNWFTR